MAEKDFEIVTDEVEFDEELYQQNLKENDFSVWETEEGKGTDDVKGEYDIKCPYSMNPSAITRHDTYNDASAMAEISYMIGNNKEVSFHYAVDDYRAVQGIPTNRNAWACGDGSKPTGGNRTSINVETCYSKSGGERYTKAADNALTLIAKLMKEHGIPSTRVYYHRHWSGKNCPHRTIAMGISEKEYQQMVQARYNEMYGGGNVVVKPIPPTGTTYKVGDTVTINGVYTSSGSNNKLHPAKTSGKITKIVKGARNPYLLENGNIGWVNDDCITGKKGSSSSSSSSSKKSISTIAKEVIAGEWGNGDTRKKKLEAAGYDYDAVQKEVNKQLNGGSSSSSSKKSISTVAKEVIAGEWGNGDTRRKKLEAAGYDYDAVQKEVNKQLNGGGSSKKSNKEIAKEVIAGKWGNGETRKKKLEAAGYDYNAVQKEVNKLL